MFLPTLWRAHERLVLWLWSRGNNAIALRVADWYTRMRPRDPQGWRIRYEVVDDTLGGDAGEAVLLAGIQKTQESVLLLQLHLRLLLANGLTDEAEVVISRIREADPDSADALVGAAAVAAHRRDFHSARDLCRQAARKISPAEEGPLFLTLISVVLLLPDGRDWAKELVETLLRNTRNWAWPKLLMSLLIRCEDPARSAQLQSEARQEWRAPKHQFDYFLRNLSEVSVEER